MVQLWYVVLTFEVEAATEEDAIAAARAGQATLIDSEAQVAL